MVILTVTIRIECQDLDDSDDKYTEIKDALSSIPGIKGTGTSSNHEVPFETQKGR